MLQLAPHPASIAGVGGSIRASSACSQDQVFTVPVGRVNAAFVPFARPSLRALVVGRSNRRRVVAAVELSLLENIALSDRPFLFVAVTPLRCAGEAGRSSSLIPAK